MSTEPRAAQSQPTKTRRLARWTAQSVIHFGVWLAFSGHFEPEFLALGVIAAIAATAAANWLFHGVYDPLFSGPRRSYGWIARAIVRFVLYIPWLLWEIVVSNFHVAYLVLHPKLPVAPSLVEFETTLVSERAQVLLAQSITLTPGTVTVDASNSKFVVHCLSAKSREGLEEGDIQRKVAGVFEEFAPDRVTLHEITSPSQVPQ